MLGRLILMMLVSLPAGAQMALADSPIAEVVCGPREVIIGRLKAGSGAQLAGSGLRDMDTMIEVWAEPSGNWTLVQTHANGQVCILAMGEAWEALVPPPA